MAGEPVGIAVVDHGLSFGGSVVVAATLLKAVDRRTFAPLLISAAPPGVVAQHVGTEVPAETLIPGFTYQDVSRIRHRLDEIRPRALARLTGYPTMLLAEAANLAYVFRLVGLFRRERIRLVHMNNGLANVSAGLAAALLGIPTVVHAHGTETSSKRGRWLAARARGFIAISEFIAGNLVEFGIPPAMVRTIRNPIPATGGPVPSGAEARRRFGIGESELVFGIVGRIIQWKGQLEFLEAAFLVLARIPDAVAIVVGDNADDGEEYLALVRERVRTAGMDARVRFTGFVSDTRPVYAMLDVLVHSSIEPEPFGLVITEAMAAGVPVVAADRGAPPEIIADGVDGFLRDPSDAPSVAEAIVTLLSDPALRRTIGERGRATVRDRYDPERYARSVEEVWRDALSGAPRASA